MNLSGAEERTSGEVVFYYFATLLIVQVDAEWLTDDPLSEDDGTLSVADLATPYLQSRAGPTWWCHVDARHPNILSWLANSQWLHPAISAALRDETRLISDRMKHLLYEVATTL